LSEFVYRLSFVVYRCHQLMTITALRWLDFRVPSA
jgi:hypothetical protein